MIYTIFLLVAGKTLSELSLTRIKRVQDKFSEQTKLISGTGKPWYSQIQEFERDLEEDAWRLRIMHFNENNVKACESFLTVKGVWYRVEIDPSIPTKLEDGTEIPLPSNRIIVTGGFRNLNNKTGEERAKELQEELKNSEVGWYSILEQFKVSKLDYSLWLGHFTQKDLPDIKKYLDENEIFYKVFKEKMKINLN